MKVTPATSGATGPGKGELYDILKALVTTVNELRNSVVEIKADFNLLRTEVAAQRTAYEAHRADATAHASADSTNTVAAMTSTAIVAADPTATGLTV